MTHEVWADIAPAVRVIGWCAFVLAGAKALLVLSGASLLPGIGSAAAVASALVGLVLLAITQHEPATIAQIKRRVAGLLAVVTLIVLTFPFGMPAV